MAENKKGSKGNGESESRVQIPIVSYVLRLLFRMFYIAVFAGAISLLLEWALFALDQDMGYKPSYQRYVEIAETITTKGSPLLDEASLLERITIEVDGLYKMADQNAQHYASMMSQDAELNFYPAQKILGQALVAAYEFAPNVMLIWLFATLTWTAKMLTIIAMALPYCFIISLGVADGLAVRKINTYKGVRDSIDRLEYWMYTVRSTFYIVFFFYLAIPSSFSAYTFIVPMALVSAFLIRQVVCSYKKYG